MENVISGCRIIDFGYTISAGRNTALLRDGRFGNVIPFPARRREPQIAKSESGIRRGGSPTGWDLSIARRTAKVAKALAGAKTGTEFALAGLDGGLEGLGIRGIAIPSNAAQKIERSLTYRIPREGWEALHRLDYSMQDEILLAMLSSMHDGRVRRRTEGIALLDNGHLLLPMELACESTIRWETCALMRILPCLGLDRGVEDYSDYGMMFAYEDDGAADSLCYEPLLARYRKARAEFMRENSLFDEGDLTDYIMAYGRSSELLCDAASKSFQERSFARKTALVVQRNNRDWGISK